MLNKYSACGLLFQLSLAAFLAPGEGNAQVRSIKDVKVDILLTNGHIEKAFQIIEKQTPFVFVYTPDDLKHLNNISLAMDGQRVSDVLLEISKQSGLQFKQVNENISVKVPESDGLPPYATPGQGQSKRTITGKVISEEEGEALPGVNIVVKGTTRGTVTDTEGNYEIDIFSDNAILVLSSVGFASTEVQVPAHQLTTDVVMTPDVQSLGEVVVVGYGTMKKSDLTGAVERAELALLENSAPVNVMEGLKGVTPGLTIGPITKAGDNPAISIRGRNSISGTNSPLIVLDGIIYRGAFTDINPGDIESIDVLKDASSAAIYGSQGANGVLLITSKTAKDLTRPIFEYTGNYSFLGLMNNKLTRLDRDGFLNQLADVYISDSRMGDDLLERNPGFDPTQLFRDEVVSSGYADGTDVDWWDMLSAETPYIQNHNVSLRGRNEVAGYFISLGYTDQQNLVKNDTYQRYGLRVNLDAQATDWLSLGTQSFFTSSDFSGNNTVFSNLISIPALVNPYHADGTLREQVYLGAINPLLSIDNPDKDIRQTLTGNFYALVDFPWIKGLTYRVNYSNNLTTYRDYNFNPYPSGTFQNNANKRNSRQNAWTLDHIITYKNHFGSHALSGTLVYGVEELNYEMTNTEARNFTDVTLGYHFMQGGQADLNRISTDAWKENSLYTMLRAIYSFKDRYIFTGTVRRDGFSGFSAKNKFGVFPSAAVAWRISEENFLKNNLRWIDNLKLRYSYGQGGNRTIGRYSTLARMTDKLPSDITGGYLFGDGAAAELTQAIRTMANEDLKWETTTSSNFGLDFSILKGRLSGSYNYYLSNTTDLLYNISVPSINGTVPGPEDNGFVVIPTNIGGLRNMGHELSITGVPIMSDKLQWNITGNFSTNKNEVLTILGIDNDGDGKEDDLVASNIFIGQPLGTIYDYEIIGMWQVDDFNKGDVPAGFSYGTYKIADLNRDGAYTPENDRRILGYETPLYQFSIINNVRAGSFEFKAFIYSIQGGKNHYLGRPAELLPIPDHLTNVSYFKFDYWTPENPEARYRQLGSYTPALGETFSPYVSRSFIRLQELSLAYHVPDGWLEKWRIRRARIWVSGFNLFTITKWDGWDPEANQGLTYDLDPDNDNDKYPTMKRYTIGVNFAF